MNKRFVKKVSWLLTQTKTGQEELALENLVRQGFCVYLPKVQYKINLLKPLFPGYLFIKYHSQEDKILPWAKIRCTKGVLNLVKFGSSFATASQTLIEEIRFKAKNFINTPEFKPGERISVKNYPFSSLDAVYLSASGIERCVILIKILNTAKKVHLPVNFIQRK